MATARPFSELYNLVATLAQDASTAGIASAKAGINTTIKEITREFKLPSMFKGQDNSVYVSPSIGVGPQLLTLASDIVRLENVFFIDSGADEVELEEVTDDESWIIRTDQNSQGDPELYRDFETNSAGVHQIQIWKSPNASWVSRSGGKLYYTYWGQLVQLSADSDIPNIPYELDTVLINGGIVEVARSQGDSTLIGMYESKYEDDKKEIRAWLIKQKSKDGQLEPGEPMGVFGRERSSRGYKPG